MPEALEIEVLCSATLRALTGDPDLQWSAHTLYSRQQPLALSAAHLQVDGDEAASFATQRARTDAAALRLAWSDPRLFAAAVPAEPVAHLVFELLEQLRTESLAPPQYQGLVHNLQRHFLDWSHRFVGSGLTETDVGILLFTVAVSAWSRLTGHPPDEDSADLMEATRANIMPILGTAFAGLKQHRHDQVAYAVHAAYIARWVAQAVEPHLQAMAQIPPARKRRGNFALAMHFNAPPQAEFAQAVSGASATWEASHQQYRVYTRRYDTQVEAARLVRPEQLTEFREALDADIARCDLNLPRLVRYLRWNLARPQEDGWNFEQEEGLLDGRTLAQLVASPQARHVFRSPALRRHADCAVTLLLDCSGSMKTFIPQLSVMADVLARALDGAGVASEVLGFTTGAWTGGRARKDWLRAGSPSAPGRLNESLHLVLKAADTPWRRARRSPAALRKPDMSREGRDGEALEWACARLRALPARRRILLVVSDGCPMDTATHAANDDNYLDQHLQAVLRGIQARGDVEVSALGVGLDLGAFYRHRLAVDWSGGLDDAMLMAIVRLICGPRRHGTGAPPAPSAKEAG